MVTKEKLADIDKVLARLETNPHDTHPALTDRIAYARSLPDSSVEEDTRPATVLLADASAAECEVTRHFALHQTTGKTLEHVAWRDVPKRVYAPKLAEEAQTIARKVSRALARALQRRRRSRPRPGKTASIGGDARAPAKRGRFVSFVRRLP